MAPAAQMCEETARRRLRVRQRVSGRLGAGAHQPLAATCRPANKGHAPAAAPGLPGKSAQPHRLRMRPASHQEGTGGREDLDEGAS